MRTSTALLFFLLLAGCAATPGGGPSPQSQPIVLGFGEVYRLPGREVERLRYTCPREAQLICRQSGFDYRCRCQ